jgi:hypothetical protein
VTASVLQEVTNNTQYGAGGTGTTLTLTATVTAGSTLWVIGICDDVGTFTGVSDTLNGSYGASIDAVDDSGAAQRAAAWAFQNSAGGSNTITLTTSSTNWRAIYLAEVGGVRTSSLDGHIAQLQTAPGTGTDGVTSGNATSANQPALVVGLAYAPATTFVCSAGTGFTTGASDATIGLRGENKRVTSTGNQAATFTAGTNDHVISFVAVFDETAGPVINTQPTNQTAITPNPGSATFTVSATASAGSLSYQWTKNGSNVGTNSSSYTPTGVTFADNLSSIQCAVTDSNGTTLTNTVLLFVVAEPPVAWMRA